MPLFIDAHNYVSCHRCHCFFIPIDVSPTTATVRCPSCNTTSRLPNTRQPPPQPPSTPSSPLSSLTEDDDYLDSSFEEDDDFVTDVNWPAEADDYEPNTTPAANSFINSLKTLKRAVTFEVLKQLDEACVICLDEFILEEIVNEMPCGHWFHSDCIIKWLSLKNTCPLCRYEIPKEPSQDIILRSFWIVGLQQRQWLQNSSVREPDRNILLHSRILENSSSYARPREDLT